MSLTGHKLTIYNILQRAAFNGATKDQMCHWSHVEHSSIEPALRAMEERKLLACLVETRPTRLNNPAHVYVLPQFIGGRLVIPYIPYIQLPQISQEVFDWCFSYMSSEERGALWQQLQAAGEWSKVWASHVERLAGRGFYESVVGPFAYARRSR